MKNFATSLLGCLLAASAFAQDFLPRYATPEEIFLQTTDDLPGKPPVSAGITDPPNVPVRAQAEWEESQALLIAWNGQNTILTEIVRAARLEAQVLVACSDQTVVNSAVSTLLSKGVDTANVRFLLAPNNSIWCRDYGPNSVYLNDVDSLALVDWIYNRNRPKDDHVSDFVATALNIPEYTTTAKPNDLVHTGGNYMSDGMGLAFSSKLFLDENGPNGTYSISKNRTEADCDSIMAAFMGIHTYPKMTTLPYDVIHHIDMHMKLIDEETLLVGQYPAGVADGPQIEANLQFILSNFKTSFGTPFKVIRIIQPPEGTAYPNTTGDYRTYSNAVFVNKTVILPTYEAKYDTTALRIWHEALPGYNIVGIDCNAIIPSLGAIHCITHEIGVADPLMIKHKQLEDVVDNNVPGYPVLATMKHRSGITAGRIFWATSPLGPWQIEDMNSLSSQQHVWGAQIPVQPEGTTIYYYLEGEATSGKHGLRPMPAPAGYWKFKILKSSATAEAAPARLAEIYPNPARAITCVPIISEKKMAATVRIFNVFGQLVQTIFEGEIPAGGQNLFFDAGNFPAGTYFVELTAGGLRQTQKVVVE